MRPTRVNCLLLGWFMGHVGISLALELTGDVPMYILRPKNLSQQQHFDLIGVFQDLLASFWGGSLGL